MLICSMFGKLYSERCCAALQFNSHPFLLCLLFDIGKDPLPDKVDGNDINSVAGVLKLYFRELKEPLFPSHIFDDLITCSTQHNFNSQYTGSLLF